MPKDAPETFKPQNDIDTVLHSTIARFTGGLSPTALSTAALDWGMHLVGSPTRQAELWNHALSNASKALAASAPVDATDKRFEAPEWSQPPFCYYRNWFSLVDGWWQHATAPIEGVDPAHQRIVAFLARQVLDMVSPSNAFATNPEVLDRTWRTGGLNLAMGLQNWIDDFNRLVSRRAPELSDYRVGETIAATPGDVILRNELIELIRYRPTTDEVHAEPILIVPAWIMKYYILDLSPENSLVAWLRDQGFEVYIISWKNPGVEDAGLGLQDYVTLGVKAAMDHIAPDPEDRLHAVGYCLGGTLLAAVAAALGRDGDERLKTLTLLAAQVDFTEPGEISLFINESQVAFLEDMMATQGYLRADQMAGAFRMLRSNDLIWSRVVRHYLLGEPAAMNDLMAWNADATRMPARMHSEYLRQMFLENRLAKGRFEVDGGPVALTNIKPPVFVVGTETDHVSPWVSVYALNLLVDSAVSFCLTNGGHNSGILSEPGHAGRHYRLGLRQHGARYSGPEAWFERTEPNEGSWWPAWAGWLAEHGGGKRKPKTPGATLCPAPGDYVLG